MPFQRKIALAAALMVAGPAAAVTPASTAPITTTAPDAPDPAALDAAREMMKAADLQAQMRALGPSLAQGMETQMRQQFSNEQLPAGLQSQITTVLTDFIRNMDSAFTPGVVDEMAGIYARHFSVDDLKHITALLRDPAMQRFRNEQPKLMGELMPVMFKALAPQQQALQARLKQIIFDWIKQHPEDKPKLRNPNAT